MPAGKVKLWSKGPALRVLTITQRIVAANLKRVEKEPTT